MISAQDRWNAQKCAFSQLLDDTRAQFKKTDIAWNDLYEERQQKSFVG